MARELFFNEEAQTKLLNGVEAVASAVKSTLGPNGSTVAIDQSFKTSLTKDGVSVAREIELEDKAENMGVQLVVEASQKTATDAGDGTTTTVVLTEAILKEGRKYVTAGANVNELRRGINRAVKSAVEQITKCAIPVKTNEDILNIATISANGDETIGRIIAEAMEVVGKDGVVTVGTSKTGGTYLDKVEGIKIDGGYISPLYMTNIQTQECVLDNRPYVLLYDGTISTCNDIIDILQNISKDGKELLVICGNADGEFLQTTIVNKMRGALKVCVVKNPGVGERNLEILADIGCVTGAHECVEGTGAKLSNVTFEHLGRCDKIVVTKDSTTFIGGKPNQQRLTETVDMIRAQIDNQETSDYERLKLKERLGKLSGGVAVINVGASTEVELSEIKDRVDDALCATRAAIKSGIVEGGGKCLLNVRRTLSNVDINNPVDPFTESEKLGWKIVIHALSVPCKTIAWNGGISGDLVITKLESFDDYQIGYDALNDTYVNMFEAGIVDPADVVICSLQNAASVASTMLTTKCLVVNIPEKKGCGCGDQQHGMMM